MPSLLEGQTLVWLSWDELGTFTAATRQMLTEHLAEKAVTLQLLRPASLEELTQLVQRQPTSLITLKISKQLEIAAACKTFARIRGRIDQPICVAFLEVDLLENIPLLLEAGAQIVVSQLPSWQRSLPNIVARAPLTRHNSHPLVSGLLDRLPIK